MTISSNHLLFTCLLLITIRTLPFFYRSCLLSSTTTTYIHLYISCFQGNLTNANVISRVELPCFGKANKNNVGPVVFNGDISITQKAAGNRCTLRLHKSEYSLQERRFALGSADDDEEHLFVGYFSMPGQMPACRIDTDKDDDESNALASACPLAKLSSTFREIRLVVSSDMTDWKQDVGAVTKKPEVLRGQLAHLCTGHSSANPESKWSPVTSPASKKLKTFMEKAEERRAAAKAAAMRELAAMERKHIDEKVKLEKEQSETQQLLEEDIAAELEALRFEAQMEGS